MSEDVHDDDTRVLLGRASRITAWHVVIGLAAVAVGVLIFVNWPRDRPARTKAEDRADVFSKPMDMPRPAPAPPAREVVMAPPQPQVLPQLAAPSIQALTRPAAAAAAPTHHSMIAFGTAAPPAAAAAASAAAAGANGQPASAPGGAGAATAVAFKPAELPGVKAGVMPDRTLIAMPQIVQCNLDVAIDSTVPGPIMCHLEHDVLSPFNVVLMERGTLITGEYRQGIQQGQDRIMAMSATAYTPFGVVVPLDGPFADGLGRAGIPGTVDHHNLERFGGALLMSFANSAFASLQALAQGGNNNQSFTIQTGSLQNVASDVLRSTIGIPPTLSVNQGATVSIYIRFPIDFSPAYRLRTP